MKERMKKLKDVDDLSELIGKRILYTDYVGYKIYNITEADVMEISPSGNFIKLRLHRSTCDMIQIWIEVSEDIILLDVLN